MNKLISKNFLFFLGSINPSYAKNPLNYFKKATNKCKLTFTNQIGAIKSTHNLITRLNNIIGHLEGQRDGLILLEQLHAFRKNVKKSSTDSEDFSR